MILRFDTEPGDGGRLRKDMEVLLESPNGFDGGFGSIACPISWPDVVVARGALFDFKYPMMADLAARKAPAVI